MQNRYTVSVKTTEQAAIEFDCRSDHSIFESMLKTGKSPFRAGCGGGACGICKVYVISGQYEVIKPMGRGHITEEEEQDGKVLACCISPRSDMVIEIV